MQMSCFSAAWRDVRESHGWFRKVLLLALLMFIPVFGWIVSVGYLLGWARDIAWGVRAPLPASIFGNEDGNLYSRGFFAWVIQLVFMLLLWVAFSVLSGISSMGAVGLASLGHIDGGFSFAAVFASFGFALIVLAMSVVLVGLVALFIWIGWLRMSIYGRLSAGFQIGRIWAMLRHDTGGILRIFGMFLVVNIVTIVILFFMALLVGILLTLGMVATFEYLRTSGNPSAMMWVMLLIMLLLAAAWYVGTAVAVFSTMLTVRATGYWVQQFDVPHWRGQDDPMPFETAMHNQPSQPQQSWAPPDPASQVGSMGVAVSPVGNGETADPHVTDVQEALPKDCGEEAREEGVQADESAVVSDLESSRAREAADGEALDLADREAPDSAGSVNFADPADPGDPSKH